MPAPVIVWFRQDLRLADHPALTAACAAGGPVLPVYVRDTPGAGRWTPGGASRWWLHGSLERLAADLARRGGALVLRSGDSVATLTELVRESGAGAVYWSRGYEPGEAGLEERLRAQLGAQIELRRFAGRLLWEPEALRTASGRPFQVFTPFWKAGLAAPEPRPPVPAPDHIPAGGSRLRSERLADWTLLPDQPDWSTGLRATWQPGEAAAFRALTAFVDDVIGAYPSARDLPGIPGTSRLSPHLHCGEISPRQIWHAVRAGMAGAAISDGAGMAFLRELGWREFSAHLLYHWPRLPDEPLRPEFAGFPWAPDPELFRRWCRGTTGYPLIDAGMRELWTTGWMHNRVRMIVASFLVKDLLVSWQDGEAWFWDTLVDADLASNAASWQWVAGCGADAAPYFRVFNPVLQSRRFDADGSYIRRWVPEIACLPDAHLHAPWEAPERVLQSTGVVLGSDYPLPVIDHRAARQRALDAYASLRSGQAASRGA